MGKSKALTSVQEYSIAKDRSKRMPVSDIAIKYGVSEETIYRTIRREDILTIIDHLTLELIGDVLTTKFIDGSTADRELYLKFSRGWNPKKEIKINTNISVDPDLVSKLVQEKLNGEKKEK